MKFLLTIFAFIFGSSVFAANPSFDAWAGSWKGVCKLTPPYSGTDHFDMSLTVTPQKDKTHWQMIYEASGSLPRQVREYDMVPVDQVRGHYVVDENNGLLLDSFLEDTILRSNFSINGNIIHVTYIMLSQDDMLIDMPTYFAKPVRKTYVKGAPTLCADSFNLKMSQTCKLTRVK